MAINVPIYANFNDRGLKDAESAFESFGSKVGNIAKTAATAVAAIGTAAAVGAFKAIQQASDLSETTSKIGVLFGDQASVVTDWAKGMAASFGQSEQSALDAAATFATFAQAAGLSSGDAVDFSTDLTELASDMASFSNTTPEDAIAAIGAALRGESESIRRFGVMLDDATLKQTALEMGIYDGNGALTQQQKILAAERAIYKQTTNAQGDFDRTSDGLANQQRILKAQLENVVTTIGEKLLPIAQRMTSFFADKVMPVIESLTEAFSEGGFAGVMSKLGEYIKVAMPPALNALRNMLNAIGRWLRDTALPWLVEKLGQWTRAFWEWIKEVTPPALRQLGEWLGDLANWLINDGLPLMVEKLIELGNALVDWIKPRIAPALKALGEWLGDVLHWIITEALPKLTEQALKLAGALLSWLADLLPQALLGLGQFVLEIVKELPSLFMDLVSAMTEKGLELGQKLIEGILEFFANLPGNLLNWIIDHAGDFLRIGREIGAKIGQGVMDALKGSGLGIIGNFIFSELGTPGSGSENGNSDKIKIKNSQFIPITNASLLPNVRFANASASSNNVTVNVMSADPNEVVRALQSYNRNVGKLPVSVQ